MLNCTGICFLAVSVGKCSVAIALLERANLKDVCKEVKSGIS
jgi:hypothetical protein